MEDHLNTLSNEDGIGNKLEDTSSKNSSKEEKDDRTARCEYCDKVFSCNKNLRQHIKRVHFKILEKCPDCDKYFAKEYLKLHREAVQLKKQRKECQDCGMSITIPYLASHQRYSCKAKNITVTKVMCHLCGKETLKHRLQKHMRAVHNGNAKVQSEYVQCDLCPKRIGKRHMKRHKAFHRKIFIKALRVDV